MRFFNIFQKSFFIEHPRSTVSGFSSVDEIEEVLFLPAFMLSSSQLSLIQSVILC